MQIRLATAWEVLGTLLVGTSLSVYVRRFSIKLKDSRIDLADDTVATFLAVAAMAGGIGLGLERARRRDDGRAWGVGRWCWSLSALATALTGVRLIVERPWRRWNLEGKDLEGVTRFAVDSVSNNFTNLGFYFAAFFLISGLAGFPRDAAPDLREWSGRGFGGLVIFWEVADSLITAM